MSVNVGALLTRRAYREPDEESIVEPSSGRRLTNAELNARSNRVANALTDAGVEKGDRVALLLMNGAEFVESFFAGGKIGAVIVPLNWRLVADELEFILSDAGATVLIFGADFADVAGELRARGSTAIATWIQLDGAPTDGVVSYDDWIAAASDAEPQHRAAGDDLLFIMYTSGTTGLPKGVMQTHHTVFWATLTIASTSDFRKGDTFLNSLPLFHVGALVPVVVCIYSATSIVLLRSFDPVQAWELIRDEHVSTTLMVPAMLQFMLAVHDPSVHDTSSLRWCLSGAAPVPVSLIEAYGDLNIEIQQIYGLTEAGGPACQISSIDAAEHVGSTGKAFYFTEVRVVRADGSDCEPDEAGEVIVRGEHVMPGYWNQPDATADAIRDGWLHTGDVATMDADGFVTIVDRVKDMLISGGENVYPAEIENVLVSHPKIADAGVIGIPSDRWGESPMAVVVAADPSLTADEVIEFTNGKLAAFKTVKAVEFVEQLPRNPSGKILKRELREQFVSVAG
ncbi:MAG: long-chain-fatty-acid--CoA ligase [Actinomycetota bacterium]